MFSKGIHYFALYAKDDIPPGSPITEFFILIRIWAIIWLWRRRKCSSEAICLDKTSYCTSVDGMAKKVSKETETFYHWSWGK